MGRSPWASGARRPGIDDTVVVRRERKKDRRRGVSHSAHGVPERSPRANAKGVGRRKASMNREEEVAEGKGPALPPSGEGKEAPERCPRGNAVARLSPPRRRPSPPRLRRLPRGALTLNPSAMVAFLLSGSADALLAALRLVVFLAAAAASESRARKFRVEIPSSEKREKRAEIFSSEKFGNFPPGPAPPPSGAPPVVERRGSATENPQEAFWLVSRSRSRTSRGPTACPHSSLPVTGANPKPAPRLGRETSTAPAICFRCPC